MLIRKVKQSSGMITIRAEEALSPDGDEVRRIELESRAEPRPEFHEAMGELIGPSLRMIEAPSTWEGCATISGVAVTHEEERGMGAVVTLLVPLKCAPSPLVINTPYLPSEDPGECGAPVLPQPLRLAIERVCVEAQRYLDGERAQGDLFGTADMADNAAAGDDESGADYNQNYSEAVDPETGEVNPGGATASVTISAEQFGRMADAVKRAGGIRPARGRRAEKVDA